MAPIGTGSLTPSRTNAGRMKSAGCSRVSATIRRMTGLVRSRRGRAPGKDPYFAIHLRYARPAGAFADAESAPRRPRAAARHGVGAATRGTHSAAPAVLGGTDEDGGSPLTSGQGREARERVRGIPDQVRRDR
ncbi:hypothetical protein GCM10010335_58050 [Streptomyces galbus]|nr:hypothetical protein GCM10010335_58050 [Streptomyces galbus]